MNKWDGQTDEAFVKIGNMTIANDPDIVIQAEYTNWRGIKSLRKFTPIRFEIGNNEWHPETCLLMLAYDYDKCAERTFKVNDLDTGSMEVVTP